MGQYCDGSGVDPKYPPMAVSSLLGREYCGTRGQSRVDARCIHRR
jgi:hypothetical protein